MTEPRTSRRVARVVLLVLVLGLVAVALPTVPAVWEWAAYSGEWKPIVKAQTSCYGTGAFGKFSFFKAKQKRLRWLPGADLIMFQIGKKEFQSLFPNKWSQLQAQEYLNTVFQEQ